MEECCFLEAAGRNKYVAKQLAPLVTAGDLKWQRRGSGCVRWGGGVVAELRERQPNGFILNVGQLNG